VTTFEVWPETRQTLKIYRNELPQPGNWIGVRLRETPGRNVMGTEIILEHDGLQQMQPLLSGELHRSQRAAAAHFGLGTTSNVDRVIIRWPDGRERVLENPAVNEYTRVQMESAEVPP